MKTSKLVSILFYTCLIILVIFFLFPIFYLVLSSFKPAADLWKVGFNPAKFTLENYRDAFANSNYALYTANTIFTTFAATFITIVINTMCGYALAKFKFRGAKPFIGLVMATMMMPLVLVMTPVFIILKTLGLYNSLWALIIPPAATPAGIFIMRQYLLTIPDELLEAARIDGAHEWGIFARIIIPIATPAIATLSIFSFMWRWNDYIWPLIAISSNKKFTLQVALSQYVGENDVIWTELIAMSTLTVIPVLIVFLIFQRQFIQGVASSGLKG
jgi:alpha-1,4-digalacturonate transport system permease protein